MAFGTFGQAREVRCDERGDFARGDPDGTSRASRVTRRTSDLSAPALITLLRQCDQEPVEEEQRRAERGAAGRPVPESAPVMMMALSSSKPVLLTIELPCWVFGAVRRPGLRPTVHFVSVFANKSCAAKK